ncbi:PucR family transcriptional regulator [Planococcus lenghuensis]|uniref:Regulator of polyketide synthase expression n=1 Tax=Planococcus lenghuensis TaxID=2213202 RepID=A0A1Q2KVX0_9BACL|nr:helix-turn-helix domain-containing protein [Planococcus lenghuensis]AQQ52341.1 regulator of polyketide synthase expression [Planococcus lenghuensis]
MVDSLRAIYPSLIIYEEEIHDFDRSYKWFVTKENDIIGIRRDELTSKDIAVLNAFLMPYDTEFPFLTDEERDWQAAVAPDKQNPAGDAAGELPYRFVYFSIRKNQISPAAFKEAIQELFARRVPILWENGHEGMLVEYRTAKKEVISYDEIIDVLMSDLYIKIDFMVGPFREGRSDAAEHYTLMLKAAKTVFHYSNQPVALFLETVPYLLIDQADPELYRNIRETVLQEYINDEETLKMIEVFTRSNLNISETAKSLHLHRNSLQYRLDRFMDNTGIDIRKFHNAMTVYLALLGRD